MEKIGAKLKKVRLEKGMSLEEVHKKTKIHLHILKAIEDDSFVNINPVYLKGFLNIYCTLLGLNPAEYVPSYKEPQVVVKALDTEEKATTLFKKSESSPKKIKINFKLLGKVLAAVVCVFLFFSIIRFIGNFFKRHPVSSPKKTKVVRVVNKKERPRPRQETSVKPALNNQLENREKALKEIKDKKEAKVIPSVTVKEMQVPSMVRLGVYTKEDSWIQVKVDGKVVFQSVLSKGRLESWSAKEKIELSLGNAGSVELEINNNKIPPLGRKGQSVKNIIITKDGFKMPR